jgi:hypothetical protein
VHAFLDGGPALPRLDLDAPAATVKAVVAIAKVVETC